MNDYNDPGDYDYDASYVPSDASDMNLDDALPYLDESIPYVDHGEVDAAKHEAQERETPVAPQEQPDVSPQKPRRRFRRIALYSVVAILGGLLVIFAGTYTVLPRIKPRTPAGTIAKNFHYAPCPFQPGNGIVEGKNLRCGFLTVPEVASQPKGKTIQLAVAIFKAPVTQGTQVPADPLIYLTGGPGGALLDDVGVGLNSSNLNRFAMGHDLILLDQRGTGYSIPALNCPELDPSTPYPTGPVLGAAACRERLLQEGINLQAYTTIADATDVHSLIHALGYTQADLYGVSYGTRLALTVMRLFPADIRSVILDSTVPTQLNAFEQQPFDIQHALDVLFHGCAISLSCNAAYPHLDQVFYQTVVNLNAHPAVIQVATSGQSSQPQFFNGNNLVTVVYSAMYDTRAIPALPQLIMQASQGNYHLISQVVSVMPFGSSTGISEGMYYTVECGEDIGFITESELDKAITVLHPQLRSGILTQLLTQLDICQDWHQKLVPAVQKQPVSSSIPTLILSGEYDPITPPSNDKLAAQTLSHSYFFEFPATGHGVLGTNVCPDTIALAFLQQPTVKPDATCITYMQEPTFQ